MAHKAFDVSLRQNPPEIELVCAKGCSFCCHTFVSALPAEIFRIANWLRIHRARELPRIVERAGATANLNPDRRHGAHLPCALLEEDDCSVYSERPLVCRKAVSFSIEACRAEFNGGKLGVEMPFVHMSFAGDVNLAMLVALRAASLPDEAYEFSAALKAALANPNCEREWLDGHEVFAGVYQEKPPKPLRDMVADLARQM